MLAALGFATMVVLLFTIIGKKLPPMAALSVIPLGAGFIGGFGLETFDFAIQGIRDIAPVAGLFLFAILFFGVMREAGLFEPAIQAILRRVGKHPGRIALGTALLATVCHLDGSGASTFLIVIPAMLPVYERLGISRYVLACVVAMAAGVANMLPWGGPTLRASAALDIPLMELYLPLVPVQLLGFAFVYCSAYWIGSRQQLTHCADDVLSGSDDQNSAPIPPKFVANLVLTFVVIALLTSGVIAPILAFLLGLIVALFINCRDFDTHQQTIEAHAPAALAMVAILMAAGVFTGVMKGSGMLSAMGNIGTQMIPDAITSYIPHGLAILAVPLSLLFDPDSFYFGILPVVAEVAGHHGVSPVVSAHAALLGQSTLGFPVSPLTPATFLLVGLARIDLAEHQKFTLPWLLATSWVMFIGAMFFGVIPL